MAGHTAALLGKNSASQSLPQRPGRSERRRPSEPSDVAGLIDIVTAVVTAVPPGAAMVQLREKDLPARDMVALARRLHAVTRPRRCPLLINDRLDVAMAAGVDGVHLPGNGLDVMTARELAGPDALIGVSTHGAEEARARASAGADVIVCGPIWATPSKASHGSPLGTDVLARAATAIAHTDAALYAIGGVDSPERARTAVSRGARGIAAIRALFGAPDPGRAAIDLYRAISEHLPPHVSPGPAP